MKIFYFLSLYRFLLPLILLFVLVSVLFFTSRSKAPIINEISPRSAKSGELITIRGTHFGSERNGGMVVFGGIIPVSTSYFKWTDNQIQVYVPSEARSGFVYISVRGEASNGMLFVNPDYLPLVISGSADPGIPQIGNINKERGAPGDMIILSGKNFGLERGDSSVLFTWIGGEGLETGASGQQFVSASEFDFDYESWSDTEIRLRVPDSAATGNLLVLTDKGSSNEVFFEVTAIVGTRRFQERRIYSISFEVSVSNISSSGSNDLYLWVPRVWNSPTQREVSLISRNPEPLYEEVTGVSVYHLQDLVTGGVYDISHQYMLERFAMETRISPGQIRSYDETSRIYEEFTVQDSFVPSRLNEIVELSNWLLRGERNSWRRAKILYDYVRQRFDYVEQQVNSTSTVLAEKKGNAYDLSILYTALLRASGIPARSIGGYLVASNELLKPHYWSEFYLENFGWVPVDPVLGGGNELIQYNTDSNPGEYYFGNIENRHITLTKGAKIIDKFANESKLKIIRGVGSLQSHHEEAVGGLKAYNSRWIVLSILGE